MTSDVNIKSSFPQRCVPAQLTDVLFIRIVAFLMNRHLVWPFESLVANIALKRPLRRMPNHMTLEQFFSMTDLRTLIARERISAGVRVLMSSKTPL